MNEIDGEGSSETGDDDNGDNGDNSVNIDQFNRMLLMKGNCDCLSELGFMRRLSGAVEIDGVPALLESFRWGRLSKWQMLVILRYAGCSQFY